MAEMQPEQIAKHPGLGLVDVVSCISTFTLSWFVSR